MRSSRAQKDRNQAKTRKKKGFLQGNDHPFPWERPLVPQPWRACERIEIRELNDHGRSQPWRAMWRNEIKKLNDYGRSPENDHSFPTIQQHQETESGTTDRSLFAEWAFGLAAHLRPFLRHFEGLFLCFGRPRLHHSWASLYKGDIL